MENKFLYFIFLSNKLIKLEITTHKARGKMGISTSESKSDINPTKLKPANAKYTIPAGASKNASYIIPLIKSETYLDIIIVLRFKGNGKRMLASLFLYKLLVAEDINKTNNTKTESIVKKIIIN